MTWPYNAMWVVGLASVYFYAWRVFLPRFTKEYGEQHRRLMLFFFLVAPLIFIVAGFYEARRAGGDQSPAPSRECDTRE